MSLLRKLMGGTFESNREKGEALFEEGQFGEARLAFERALARAKAVSPDEIKAVEERSGQCRLALAQAQIAEADRQLAQGDMAMAFDLLEEAKEICDAREIMEAVVDRQKRYESEDARRLVEEGEDVSEEELMAIIAGTWTESQAEEYAALPEAFREAILSSHDKDHERAKALFEQVLSRTDLPVTPCYAWLELARERLALEDNEGAIESLDSFVTQVDESDDDTFEDDESRDRLVLALNLKAEALSRLERFDEAKETLLYTTRISKEDHNTFLVLGVFLRGREEYETAVKALNRAVELMGQMQPDFRVIRELGFTYLAMGKKDEAKESLGAVVEHLASRGEHDQFDPETTVALARLHEDKGDLREAADLFRHLAVGYDTKNHFMYNLEAARLLKSLREDRSIIERHFTRASELADNEEQMGLLEKIRQEGNL